MSGTIEQFLNLLTTSGSDVLYVRQDSQIICPCVTPEGFRDPEWHYVNPQETVCDERGHLSDGTSASNISVKAFVQPIQSTRATRLTAEFLQAMFGEVRADDHLGIFPCEWKGDVLTFENWSQSGEEFILYNAQKFLVVNANLIPDPSDGNPFHHWETGMRLIG